MLTVLKIKNIALIDELEAEFGRGLNLLTGETGSGKSIIVDSLGALTGDRVSADLIRDGEEAARIEGVFFLPASSALLTLLDESGIDHEDEGEVELIVRRDLSRSGKNRIYVNGQLVTAAFLKRLGPELVTIHGQGEQSTLFDPATHLALLDDFADAAELSMETGYRFAELERVRGELRSLKRDEAEKLQLLDILRFQVEELKQGSLSPGEADELEDEKRRAANIEKLSLLSDEAYDLLYESEHSALSSLGQAIRRIEELAGYDRRFADYIEGLQSAEAVVEDLGATLRDFRGGLEHSPERLEEIENRLAEITRLSRKYGGSVEAALEHQADAEKRLANIEFAELREKELASELAAAEASYLDVAERLSEKRRAAAKKFDKQVEASLKDVAFDKAKFETRIESLPAEPAADGIDRVEFFFSANPGEPVKPLARVASGGEASRLMLVLKTASRPRSSATATVFDEIDAGIGGRVAEAVGVKLRALAESQQVLCVTHQAQVASKADRHFVVEKTAAKARTLIELRELSASERIEEIARMLAGEKITDAARENAREMLAAA